MRAACLSVLPGYLALVPYPDHIHFQAFSKPAGATARRNRSHGIFAQSVTDRIRCYILLRQRGLSVTITGLGGIVCRSYEQRASGC
jgi:hypothetical protein